MLVPATQQSHLLASCTWNGSELARGCPEGVLAQVVTEQNRDTLVETLRSIAELMIWGDQHDPKFFEFFLESATFVVISIVIETWIYLVRF